MIPLISPEASALPLERPLSHTAPFGMATQPFHLIANTQGIHATAATLSGDGKRTTVRIDLTKGVTGQIFTLADPYRVIVDLPDVQFSFPLGTGQTEQGLVRNFRYGQFAERKARMVLDTTGPVRVENAAMAASTGDAVIFTFDLVTTDPENFGKGTGPKRPEASRKPPGTPLAAPELTAKPKSKPVIMLDPGHGGIDGGAQAGSNVLEKDVVLLIAKKLQASLLATGKYEVHMTRTKDVFVSLDQRVEMSTKKDVDLFISLHADSLAEQSVAQAIRGATVYTLSDRASDEHARRMAEKENASDQAAGLTAGPSETASDVKHILFDLMKRETSNFSKDLSNTLIKRMKRTVALSRDPQRAAAFKVLKQERAPSVLIELGYLSNLDDESLLTSADWQQKATDAITAAIGDYFAARRPSNK